MQGNMKSDFKKENDWMEIWPVFARTESLFCFLPCRVRLSAETGSLLYPHGHRPAQRQRKLCLLWDWTPRRRKRWTLRQCLHLRTVGKIPKRCGAGGRWGPVWIKFGLALSCHENGRSKKEQWIQPMRHSQKSKSTLILSTCADPSLPSGPHT